MELNIINCLLPALHVPNQDIILLPKSGFAKSAGAICMWGIMLICIVLNVRMILKWSLLILSVQIVDKMDARILLSLIVESLILIQP